LADVTAARTATSALLPELTRALGDALLEAVSAQDMDEAAILPSGLLAAVDVLRRNGFNFLLDIGGTDHLPLTPRFEISYHFLKFEIKKDEGTDLKVRGYNKVRHTTGVLVPARYRVRVFPDDVDPVIPTLTGLWPNADWAEREVWDLFGVRFDGHPNLKRILMPDDWKGHPLRKDYPLRGLERRFNPGGRQGDVPPVITT
jgi:NADH-quinone oxidoreductase subunit C